MKDNSLYSQWLRSFEAVNIKAISLNTVAKILAITYVYGGDSSDFTLNQKFIDDIKYIQRVYHIHGAGQPNNELIKIFQSYVRNLEQFESKQADNNTDKPAPEWAINLFKERYNITLGNK